MLKRLSFLLPLTLIATFATAQTPSGCQTNNSSINGAYGFTAAEVPLGGVIMTPPGTTQTYSNTPIGKLISGVNAGVPFSASGILYFDGQGNITASLSSSVSGQVKVGTYTVNNDCTMSVTLTDTLNTAPSSPTNINPTFATAHLIGLVVGAGSEIILTTKPSIPLVNGLFASPLAIQLVRAQPFGCSTASLSGSYALIGTGIATTGTTTQAATFIAVVFFDGNGNVTAQTVGTPSSLASFQMAGTYTVNTDCSGTMSITMPPSALPTAGTGTNTPTPLSLSFILTPPTLSAVGGTTISNGFSVRPGIQFTISNSQQTLFGSGFAQ
jgi:hypothetical protein